MLIKYPSQFFILKKSIYDIFGIIKDAAYGVSIQLAPFHLHVKTQSIFMNDFSGCYIFVSWEVCSIFF
jgi:hypothetical protein